MTLLQSFRNHTLIIKETLVTNRLLTLDSLKFWNNANKLCNFQSKIFNPLIKEILTAWIDETYDDGFAKSFFRPYLGFLFKLKLICSTFSRLIIWKLKLRLSKFYWQNLTCSHLKLSSFELYRVGRDGKVASNVFSSMYM